MSGQNPESSFLLESGAAAGASAKQRSATTLGLKAALGVLISVAALLYVVVLCQSPSESTMDEVSDWSRSIQDFGQLGIIPNQYTIMMDCGSSHTSLYVYQIIDNNLTMISEYGNHEPLSNFLTNPKGAGPSLGALINKTLGNPPDVPYALQHNTPLYAFATAGMRLLDAEQVRAIWMHVRAYLMIKANNPYQFSPMQAKTMAGNYEGVYQYMTVQNIINDNSAVLSGPVKPLAKLMGIMEMGGASLQTAFDPFTSVNEGLTNFYLYGKLRSIFSTTYLGFGSDQAMYRSMQVLAREASRDATRVDDPCLLKGPEWKAVVDGRNITFVGTSDHASCVRLVLKILHLHYECLQKPCGIMGLYQPRPAGKFLALSSFYYGVYNLGLYNSSIGGSQSFTPEVISESAEKICKLSKDELAVTPPFDAPYNDTPWEYYKNVCFMGVFIPELLRAFGFKQDDDSVLYTKKYKGESVTWTRGAVLYGTLYDKMTLN